VLDLPAKQFVNFEVSCIMLYIYLNHVDCSCRSTNIPEEEKSLTLKTQEAHLTAATAQRSFYQRECSKAEEAIKAISSESVPTFNHYSFDFAQQVINATAFVNDVLLNDFLLGDVPERPLTTRANLFPCAATLCPLWCSL
jgi:hypothetical protein